jgi:hypothetical protein
MVRKLLALLFLIALASATDNAKEIILKLTAESEGGDDLKMTAWV